MIWDTIASDLVVVHGVMWDTTDSVHHLAIVCSNNVVRAGSDLP